MKETGSPQLLFENLDLTPIHPILWTGFHKENYRRPVEYQPEWNLQFLMLRQRDIGMMVAPIILVASMSVNIRFPFYIVTLAALTNAFLHFLVARASE